jgi:uncharacterized protein (DUF2236 family)
MSQMTSYLGWKIDFGSPPGEPAFFAPDSMAWRIYKNPVALGVGGVAAVLLEFADARIRSGVWDHSVYKQDPIGRSRRTGVAAMVGVYGPQSAARRVIQGVNNMHARVAGLTPGGEAYRALDPELLDWVSATAAFGFVTAYDRFVARLSAADQARYWSEGSGLARLYGVTHAPRSTDDFLAMMERLLPRFEPHPIVGEFLGIIESGGAAPGVPRYLQRALARGAVSILPAPVRARLALGSAYDLTRTDRLALRAMGALAERVGDPRSAPCAAAVRLGLPRDFVYRSQAAQRRLLAARPAAAHPSPSWGGWPSNARPGGDV